VSGIAFADVAEKVATLKKGDALAVVGSMKPTTWADKASGEERHGLNITVQAALSPYDVKKRRGNTGAMMPSKPVTAPVGPDDGFDDPMDF
jgi:single-strand DNA-binding protein